MMVTGIWRIFTSHPDGDEVDHIIIYIYITMGLFTSVWMQRCGANAGGIIPLAQGDASHRHNNIRDALLINTI